MAIRTAWSSTATGDSRFGAGCGIVWDSDPTEEFEELKTKARILRQPDPQFHLFETMGIVNGEIPRLSRHLFRLANSAKYWSFDFDTEVTKQYLDDVIKQVVNGHENDRQSASTFRLRLQLDRHGALSHRMESIELSPMESPQSKEALHTDELPVVELALVQTAVSADDTFLTHKTSRREAYDRAMEEIPGGCEPVMFNTSGNVTESAIANIVYQMDGNLFTPPLTDGLLPGVLRDELLDQGVITERTLPVVDLKSVEAFWLINSLRGWRKAILAEDKV